ncbi:MAG TPA: hypothetical protein VEL76_35200 [Gemmataceae bacterium]|nr:hypothetical protein [Gemmataceae bacterium]
MRNSRSNRERDVVSVPQEEMREAKAEAIEPPVIDLTLLPAASRPTPVRDMQHWLDLCG